MAAICGHVVSIHQVLLATNSQSLTNTITPDVEAGRSYQLSRLRKWLIYSANGKPSIIFEDSDLLSMKLWCDSKNLGITVQLLHWAIPLASNGHRSASAWQSVVTGWISTTLRLASWFIFKEIVVAPNVRSSSLRRITEIQDPWGSVWRVSLRSVDLWLSPTGLKKAWKTKTKRTPKRHSCFLVHLVSMVYRIFLEYNHQYYKTINCCMMIRILKAWRSNRNLGLGDCALSLIGSDFISMYFRGTWITLWMTCSRQQQRWLDHWWVERPAQTTATCFATKKTCVFWAGCRCVKQNGGAP